MYIMTAFEFITLGAFYRTTTKRKNTTKRNKGRMGAKPRGEEREKGDGEAATEEQARGREEAEEFGRFEHFDKGLISRSQEKQRRSLEERR